MKTKSLITLIFCSLSLLQAQAQVTIGAGLPPDKGVLLDLKMFDDDDGGVTSTKGLKISRVELESITSLTPLVSKDDPDYDQQRKVHKGTLVYNINTTSGTGVPEGLYYWDGEKWNKVNNDDSDGAWKLDGNSDTNPDVNFIGTTDNKALSIRTNNEKRMTISESGNIGIGLGNNTPTRKLEVVGTSKLDGAAGVYIPQLPTNTSAENAYNVVVTDDGLLERIGTTENSKVFNYIIYEITNMDEDWISNFNTRIPVSEYTLIVVGSSFKIPGDYILKSVNSENLSDFVTYGTTLVQNVYAFEDDDTWRLYADFDKGSPAKENLKCVWTLHCIAINNSMVKKFEVQEHDMKGSDIYTAPNPPPGL